MISVALAAVSASRRRTAAQVITLMTPATFGPYEAGDEPTDAYTPGTYASTAGDIDSIAILIDGEPWNGTDTLDAGSVVFGERVTDDADPPNSRDFNYGAVVVAEAPEEQDILSDLIFDAGSEQLTLTSSIAGTLHVTVSETALDVEDIITGTGADVAPDPVEIDAGLVNFSIDTSSIPDGETRIIQAVLVYDETERSNVLQTTFIKDLAVSVSEIFALSFMGGTSRDEEEFSANLTGWDAGDQIIIVAQTTSDPTGATCTVGGNAAGVVHIESDGSRRMAVFEHVLTTQGEANTPIAFAFPSAVDTRGFYGVLGVRNGRVSEVEAASATSNIPPQEFILGSDLTVSDEKNAVLAIAHHFRNAEHEVELLTPTSIDRVSNGVYHVAVGWAEDVPVGTYEVRARAFTTQTSSSFRLAVLSVLLEIPSDD